MRILVIDDEPSLVSALFRALSREHEVSVVFGGAEALDMLFEDPDYFDVILCDLCMPDLSGLELHQTLLAVHPRLAARIVFMTGGSIDAQEQQRFAAPRNPRVSKPFDLTQLRQVLLLCSHPRGEPISASATPPPMH